MIYFLYHEVSSHRRELIERAGTESQARALAVQQSRIGKRLISISACSAATAESRQICSFRDGVLTN